jgi:hypothetical protein
MGRIEAKKVIHQVMQLGDILRQMTTAADQVLQ